MRIRTSRGAVCAFLGVWVAGVAAAQEAVPVVAIPEPEPRTHGLTVDGGWADFGVVNLTKGKTGFLMGANVGLGTVLAPWIDFSGGVRYWKADIERPTLADSSKGRVRNLSFHPDLRIHMFRWKWMRPYVMTGLAAQFVSADIPSDPSLADAIGGFRVGLDTGFGISSTGGAVRWHMETRREFVEDVGNWTFALGFGWWPDQHAKHRTPERVQITPREEVVPAAPAITLPGESAGSATAPGTAASGSTAEPMVRDLMQQNEALRAEMDSLKRSMEEQKATQAAEKALEPPPAPPEPQGPGLALSLERMAALSTMSHLIPTDEGWRLVMGGEQAFESGSARLTSAAREEIRRLADVLLASPKSKVVVEGHSDSTGDALQNLTLSEDRAAAVRNELILSGVDPTTIRARGLGSGVPIADNSTPEGRSKNRRVELRITDPARAGGGSGGR